MPYRRWTFLQNSPGHVVGTPSLASESLTVQAPRRMPRHARADSFCFVCIALCVVCIALCVVCIAGARSSLNSSTNSVTLSRPSRRMSSHGANSHPEHAALAGADGVFSDGRHLPQSRRRLDGLFSRRDRDFRRQLRSGRGKPQRAAPDHHQNTAIFSLLGINYGGNGQSNFALPIATAPPWSAPGRAWASIPKRSASKAARRP